MLETGMRMAELRTAVTFGTLRLETLREKRLMQNIRNPGPRRGSASVPEAGVSGLRQERRRIRGR